MIALKRFARKVEAYLVAFMLSLCLIMIGSPLVHAANLDESQTIQSLHASSILVSSDNEDEECGDYDGDGLCDTAPED